MIRDDLINAAAGAVRPWNSTDAQISPSYREGGNNICAAGVDRQCEIDYCLFNCPYPDCCNCLAGGKQCKKGRPRKVRISFHA